MTDTPTYDAVATDQGWSPDQLSPPFNLDDFILNGKSKARARRTLLNAADRAAVTPLPIRTDPSLRKK